MTQKLKKKKGTQQLTECSPQDGNKNKEAGPCLQRQIPIASSQFVCRFHTHVNTPAEKTAEHKAYFFFFCLFLCSGVGGSEATQSERQCDSDKGNALVSHVVCFWQASSCVEFTLEKLHFCFDLIKAKYWAIVRHLAGVCLTL